jgi:hypothetical protein
MTLLAFHNDPEIKAKYLARVKAHRKADEIVKGQYWERRDGKFRGCAVGCTLHSSDHSAYEAELGIPTALAYLEDTIFENLPMDMALEWPERFLSAPKPGADLKFVVNRFLIWLLTDSTNGVIRFAGGHPGVEASIRAVAALHERVIGGDEPDQKEWKAEAAKAEALAAAWAAWAARAAARAAEARAAATAAATAAARAAARAAAWAAWAAAWEAAAAEAGAFVSFADKLIELMEAA